MKQARLYQGSEWLVLKRNEDPLESRLLRILERSRAWTHTDTIDTKAHQRLFRARKVTRWGIPPILEQRFGSD